MGPPWSHVGIMRIILDESHFKKYILGYLLNMSGSNHPIDNRMAMINDTNQHPVTNFRHGVWDLMVGAMQ